MDVQYFEVEAFAKMQELRLLQLSYVNLNGSYEHFPKDLRWLFWHGFSLEYFPTKLSLGSVVALDLQHNNLKRFWKAQSHSQSAKMLKYLDLSHSVYLRETPDFSYFPNIEKLLLINCKSLVLVHKSIGILEKTLVLLNLSSCIELDVLPEDLYKLKSLETLILSNCSKLERLDDALGKLESLTTLAADFTALKEIPYTINHLKKLKILSLDGCKYYLFSAPLLRPVSLNGLRYMRTLSLAYCNLSDELIPEDMGSLSVLHILDLRGNNFCNLPTDFASLPNLDDLILSDCSKLQSILSLPRRLVLLDVEKCISLKRIPDLSECSRLFTLRLSDCINLFEIPGIHNHEVLSVLFMERCELASTKMTGNIMLENWLKRNHECIYLPVDRPNILPNWGCFKKEMRSFSFAVPETYNFDMVVGFTLWTNFTCQIEPNGRILKPRAIMVKNLTRGGAWIHSLGNSNIGMSSNFLTNDFHIETGDQMEVDVDCDDGITIVETGIALCYKARDSLDLCKEDFFSYDSDDIIINGFRLNSGHDSLHAVVHRKTSHPMDGIISNIYACSFFRETSRYQEKNQPVVNMEENNQPVVYMEENNHRPRRKMRIGLWKILGAIGFLTLIVILGIYFELQSSIFDDSSTEYILLPT